MVLHTTDVEYNNTNAFAQTSVKFKKKTLKISKNRRKYEDSAALLLQTVANLSFKINEQEINLKLLLC